jgi:hypothetical protein
MLCGERWGIKDAKARHTCMNTFVKSSLFHHLKLYSIQDQTEDHAFKIENLKKILFTVVLSVQKIALFSTFIYLHLHWQKRLCTVELCKCCNKVINYCC